MDVMLGAQTLIGVTELFFLELPLFDCWPTQTFHSMIAFMREREYELYDIYRLEPSPERWSARVDRSRLREKGRDSQRPPRLVNRARRGPEIDPQTAEWLREPRRYSSSAHAADLARLFDTAQQLARRGAVSGWRSLPFFVSRKALPRPVRHTTFDRRNCSTSPAPKTATRLLSPPPREASDDIFAAESSYDGLRVHGWNGRVWQRVFLVDGTDHAVAGSYDWPYSSVDSHECADARRERVQPKPAQYPCRHDGAVDEQRHDRA